MIDVFFIAYEFPPLNIGGVFRPLKFVKYFNDYNIRPIIFALSPHSYNKVYEKYKIDKNLLDEIINVRKKIIYVDSDNIINVRKNKIISFFQIYFNILGVGHKKWEKYLFEKFKEYLTVYNPKAIFVTAPPFGIVELAVRLSKEINIPLIIDMRDSMSMWISQPYGSILHYILTVKKEHQWFNYAKKVITVTDQVVNDWEKVHPRIPNSKYQVIANGYDDDTIFNDIIINPVKDTFTIGYVGSFYYNPLSRKSMFTKWYKKRLHRKLQFTPRKEDWLYRSPYFFFKTINLLLKRYPSLKDKINIKFAGIKPEWLSDMINEFGLNNIVAHHGFLNFDKINDFQKECDALLITSVKVLGGEDYCIAGKTFDYLASQKPILGFVTDGAQKKFLEKSGVGIICNPDNHESSVEILKNIFINGITLKPNRKFIEKHHRKYLTGKLAEIIKSVIK